MRPSLPSLYPHPHDPMPFLTHIHIASLTPATGRCYRCKCTSTPNSDTDNDHGDNVRDATMPLSSRQQDRTRLTPVSARHVRYGYEHDAGRDGDRYVSRFAVSPLRPAYAVPGAFRLSDWRCVELTREGLVHVMGTRCGNDQTFSCICGLWYCMPDARSSPSCTGCMFISYGYLSSELVNVSLSAR